MGSGYRHFKSGIQLAMSFVLVLLLTGTKASAQAPIWTVSIGYSWAPIWFHTLVPDLEPHPSGSTSLATLPSSAGFNASRYTNLQIELSGTQARVQFDLRSNFGVGACQQTLTITLPITTTQSGYNGSGVIPIANPLATNDPGYLCFGVYDIPVSLEAVTGPFKYATGLEAVGTAAGPMTFTHRGQPITYGDLTDARTSSHLLTGGDTVVTQGGFVNLFSNWGLNVIVEGAWTVHSNGGRLYGREGGRVRVIFQRQSGDVPCFGGAPLDTCIEVAFHTGYLRIPRVDVLACPIGQYCWDFTIHGLGIVTNQAAQADGELFKYAITANVGTAQLVDAAGASQLINAGQTVELLLPSPTIVAAVAPNSRSIQMPTAATAFATILNAGPGAATGCSIALDPSQNLPLSLHYQTTDPVTNAVTGNPDTPADIPAPPPGGTRAQTFVFALNASAVLNSADVRVAYTCNGSDAVTSLTGINTLLLSSASEPVPDHIVVGLTPSNDGVTRVPGVNGIGLFVIATSNIGAASLTTVRLRLSDAAMPISALICETNPVDGQCKEPQTESVTRLIEAGENTTWTAFIQANGPLTLDPARYRGFFEFLDGSGVVRGSTSVAIMVQ